MATVLEFPVVPRVALPPSRRRSRADSRPALPSTGGMRGQYALADVARPLGLHHRPVRAIIETLRALAEHDDMPLPRTPRVVHGVPLQGPSVICQASRWDAGEFDAWLDGRGPTAPAVALPAPIRADMQARAIAIGGAR